jgi:rubrerythrin
MENFSTIDEILNFAMKNEQEAVDFYTTMSEHAKNQEMKDVFMNFAGEEVNHKARLQKIKDDGSFEYKNEKVTDLNISDYLVPAKPHPDMSYQEALILAMKKEKAAFSLYMKLSTKTDNEGLKSVFISLAQEEAKHKLRFELEYDEFILREN